MPGANDSRRDARLRAVRKPLAPGYLQRCNATLTNRRPSESRSSRPTHRPSAGRSDSVWTLLDVAERLDDFEHFAARGEHPPAAALVVVHGAHELDFVGRVVAFAGRRVDLAAAAHLRPAFADPPLDGHGNLVDAAIGFGAAIVPGFPVGRPSRPLASPRWRAAFAADFFAAAIRFALTPCAVDFLSPTTSRLRYLEQWAFGRVNVDRIHRG